MGMKMKLILILVFSSSLLAQDYDNGVIKNTELNKFDLNGDGVINSLDNSSYPFYFPVHNSSPSSSAMGFTELWESPPGAFTNCTDGAIGYFDNDTLLDVAGYTFNPNKFYIWEQVPTKPDSFALVFSYTKTEFGGFGPMATGDVDGDGKIDVVLADYSTLTRIYIISNTNNNVYLSRETQNIFVHPNDGSTAQSLLIGDLNKNGQKEIICTRFVSSPSPNGMVRLWE